jgi:hypothetical protein
MYGKGEKITGEKNGRFGLELTDEIRKSFGRSQKGEKNVMYGKCSCSIWVEKYGKEIANIKLNETKLKLSDATKGNKNPMFGKSCFSIWVEKYGIEEANIRENAKNEKIKNNKVHCEYCKI